MKENPFYEIYLSLDYKDKKKAPKMGMCEIFHTPKDITFENLSNFLKKESKKSKESTKELKKFTDDLKIETAKSFFKNVLNLLEKKRGKIVFDSDFEGFVDREGISIENNNHVLKILRRKLTMTNF